MRRPLKLNGFGTAVLGLLVAACCTPLLTSCGSSPAAPGGHVLVYVSQDGSGPAPGKLIEIVRTSLSQTTDEMGIALFTVRAGTYVVRAYDLGTPGPGRPYVEQTIEVQSARISRAEFNDCSFCR